MSRLVIGLTGGIGSGKSAASDRFAHHGIQIVDADVVAREVVAPGTEGLAAIAERHGNDVLLEDGGLDRAALRQLIFADPKEKDWLEALLHPLIRTRIQSQLASAASPYVILSSPLLVETDQRELVDRICVVDVPESVQLQRTMQRDQNDEALVRRIMAAQASRQIRRAQADDVVDNNGTLDALHTAVDTLHHKYLQLAC
jgi:dephospho-CoA kinase